MALVGGFPKRNQNLTGFDPSRSENSFHRNSGLPSLLLFLKIQPSTSRIKCFSWKRFPLFWGVEYPAPNFFLEVNLKDVLIGTPPKKKTVRPNQPVSPWPTGFQMHILRLEI